jgi:plastocyanin
MGSGSRHDRCSGLGAAVPIRARAALQPRFVTTTPSRSGLLALLLVAVFGCSTHSALTDPKTEPAAPRALNATVTVGRDCNDFVDSESGSNTTTIRAGQSVTWAWAGGSHSITSGACCTASGMWDSGVMSPGSFTRTFPSAGTYRYFCSVQKSMMTGTVVVQLPGD